MAKRIAGAVIEEQEGRRRLHLWVPLPKRRRRKDTDTVVVLLATAIVGLVVLLALQLDPQVIQLLIHLLATSLP